MLVVTIIIAAVVSGFAGGLAGTNAKKTPTLSMDIKITNSGDWKGSGFAATVTGESEPISTKDLKVVTSWSTTSRSDGSTIKNGSTIVAGTGNVNYNPPNSDNGQILFSKAAIAPYGYGQGVSDLQNISSPFMQATAGTQSFGNYSLVVGTTMSATPAGYGSGSVINGNGVSDSGGYGVVTKYTYTAAGGYTPLTNVDPMEAILGKKWENLKTGDVVTVKLIHVPTGKPIFQKDVTVTER